MKKRTPLLLLSTLGLLLLLLAVASAASVNCSGVTAWAAGGNYTVGELVTYQGSEYKCLQANNNAAPNWDPIDWPAGWSLMGTCTTGPTATPTATATATRTATATVTATRTATATATRTATATATRTATRTATATATRTATATATRTATTTATRTATATVTATATATATATTTSTPITGPGPNGNGRLLAGYWHDFDNGTGFIPLRNVPPAYDIINVAFATPNTGTADITFSVYSTETQAQFISDVAYLKSQGRKVLLSIGGGASPTIALNNSSDVSTFVKNVSALVQQYGFNGIDIDIENHNVYLNAGDNDFAHPTTPILVNLIAALNQLAAKFGSGFIISIAPETYYVQEGYDYPTTPAYIPVIYGIGNNLTYLWVQEYNSGPIMALDNTYYTPPSADFLVAMDEMVMTGFPIGQNPAYTWPGVPQNKALMGVPSYVNAGNGWVDNATLQNALNYLIKGQSFGGSYKLRNASGYPNMRGIMTWSINWDVYGGQVFSNGMRAYLNSLPAVQ